jgi:hypothetical protein
MEEVLMDLEVYHWVDAKKRDYFAIKGDIDIFFMDVVDCELDIMDQEESQDWFIFWTNPAHADAIREQYDKPITDIPQLTLEANRSFAETEKALDAEFTKEWGDIKPLNVDMSNVNREAEKELRKYLDPKGEVYNKKRR